MSTCSPQAMTNHHELGLFAQLSETKNLKIFSIDKCKSLNSLKYDFTNLHLSNTLPAISSIFVAKSETGKKQISCIGVPWSGIVA